MRTTRADRVRARVLNLLWELKTFHQTYKEWLDRRAEFYSTPDWQKATIGEKQYWRGYQVCFIENLYMNNLDWCNMGEDGIYYPNDVFRAKYGEDCYRPEVNPWFDLNKSAHVWKGTQKIFSSLDKV